MKPEAGSLEEPPFLVSELRAGSHDGVSGSSLRSCSSRLLETRQSGYLAVRLLGGAGLVVAGVIPALGIMMAMLTQGAQYGLMKQYTLNYKGIHNMI